MHVHSEPDVPPCVWVGCYTSAVGEWQATWSLFDFISYETCEEHIADVIRVLEHQLVDGQEPQAVEFVRWRLQ